MIYITGLQNKNMEEVNMLRNNKGQGMVEYILIVVLIVIVALVGVKLFGKNVNEIFTSSADKISQEASVNK